jgi:hypothetical protein
MIIEQQKWTELLHQILPRREITHHSKPIAYPVNPWSSINPFNSTFGCHGRSFSKLHLPPKLRTALPEEKIPLLNRLLLTAQQSPSDAAYGIPLDI